MVMSIKERNLLRDRVSNVLERIDLTTLLEIFDISPDEAFMSLFESGHIDPERLEELDI